MLSEHRKAVVVTGASSGIGWACALELDKQGYQVFATVRKERDAERLKKVASPNLTPVFMDVTDATSIAAAVDRVASVVDEAGLAGLVNNAGVGVFGPIELIPTDELKRQFDINLFGPVRVTQAFLPLLRRDRGRIINIGSVGGKITMPFGGALCASKYALEAVNDALRLELFPWGIDVVLVAPASISTPAVERLAVLSEATIQQFSPQGRRLYEDSFRTFAKITVESEKEGSPPQVVADVVLKALTAKRPKTRYVVGANARVLTLMSQLVPPHWLDQIRFKLFGLPQHFGVWGELNQSMTPNPQSLQHKLSR